ncbi:hypothetical protein Tco_1106666 [Tanacetum coccineum]
MLMGPEISKDDFGRLYEQKPPKPLHKIEHIIKTYHSTNQLKSHAANDNFSLHDDEELSLHDDAIFGWIYNEVWKVIQNGNSKKRVTKGKDGVYRVLPPTTQEEQFADEKERKARTLLLMAIPKDHLITFSHGLDDAKEIWAAIKTRFGGNANSKKMQISYIQKTSSSTLTADNVAFLSQAKASSSKHKPSHSSGSYSSYTTSSSKATTTATPGLADEVIHSFLATNADDVDLIHEDLDQIDDLDLGRKE